MYNAYACVSVCGVDVCVRVRYMSTSSQLTCLYALFCIKDISLVIFGRGASCLQHFVSVIVAVSCYVNHFASIFGYCFFSKIFLIYCCAFGAVAVLDFQSFSFLFAVKESFFVCVFGICAEICA